MVIYPENDGYRQLRALYALKKPLIFERVSYKAIKTPELVFVSVNSAPFDEFSSLDPQQKVKLLQYGSYTD